jgi:hypothetical protein
MTLTPEQRAELEMLGPENVRLKLTHFGAAALGFKSGTVTRVDVEDWLAEKRTETVGAQQRIQHSTLIWARIAGGAAIVGVLIGIATLYFTIWPKRLSSPLQWRSCLRGSPCRAVITQ